jgi:arginyl-tRNA synthetase
MENIYLKNIFINALTELLKDNPDVNVADIEVDFDIPKNPEYGDLSTNICMRLAKPMKSTPKTISAKLIALLDYDKRLIDKIDVAGAGFINIKFSNVYYQEQLKDIFSQADKYGYINTNKGKSVNVEYVSANPTGLLHLGHGRNAAIGDTLANLYEWTGWKVVREYYFNNAGNQMNNLANSIYARMMQRIKDADFIFPEDGYHGEYVKVIADELIKKYDDKLCNGTDADIETIRKYGEEWCFDKIKKTLKRMKIEQNIFYNEDSLYKEGKIKEVLEELKTKGLSYEKDGATWFALTKMGLETDRVIVKSTGEPTYRLPDIAYHREKLLRNYDLVVDLFGADHIATVPDVIAGVKALGFDDKRIKVILHQFVTLTDNGEQVKMSKRTGKSYTLDELLDDVGEDVVRFFLIMRGVNTHLEFDLGLAKEQNDKNPVFYLQYAHARICSIFDKIKDNGEKIDYNDADLTFLNNINEINLIKQLMLFPTAIQSASNKSEPHILCEYLRELAAAFHLFYYHCRIIGECIDIMKARLLLVGATKYVLSNGLSILGISSPEKM